MNLREDPMKRNFSWHLLILVLLGCFSTALLAQGDGKVMRRTIFRLGFILGEANALMVQQGDDPNVRVLVKPENTIGYLRLILFDYLLPYNPDGLNKVLQQLKEFDPQSKRMKKEKVAAFLLDIKDQIAQSLALTYGKESQGQLNAEPTCDSCLFDLGFHLGRFSVFLPEGNSESRSDALKGLDLALSTGRQCMTKLRCAFISLTDWNSLNLAGAATGLDVYRIRDQLIPKIFGLVSPTDALAGTPSCPPGDPILGNYANFAVTREGNEYICRVTTDVWGEAARGKVLFRLGTQPQSRPGISHPVYTGQIDAKVTAAGQSQWVKCYAWHDVFGTPLPKTHRINIKYENSVKAGPDFQLTRNE
jgi:hypothetical protein